MPKDISEERIDIAKCLLEKQWKELDYRRERENKLAAWSMVLLVGAATVITASKSGELDAVKHLFSIAATGLATLFGIFLIENRKRYEDTQRVLARQESALRAWDDRYWAKVCTVRSRWLGNGFLPPGWRKWGDFRDQILPRLDTITHLGAIWITAAAGTLVVHGKYWLEGVPYVIIPLLSYGTWLRLLRLWRRSVGNRNDWWGKPSLARSLVIASIFVYGGLCFAPIYLLAGHYFAPWFKTFLLTKPWGPPTLWILGWLIAFIVPPYLAWQSFRRWDRGYRPPAPTKLDARAHSASEVQLTWKAKGGDGAVFEIERREETGDWERVELVTGCKNYFPDSRRKPRTTYHYRVRRLGERRPSVWSSSAQAMTLACTMGDCTES